LAKVINSTSSKVTTTEELLEEDSFQITLRYI